MKIKDKEFENLMTLNTRILNCNLQSVNCDMLVYYFPTELVETEPCNPSPCGPNSHCRTINEQAICSCIHGYGGVPPSCRPECVVNSDCARDRACHNLKCIDPCLGSCGFAAKCSVINHNPVCICPPRYTGDPFRQCSIQRKIYNIFFCFE